MKVDTFFFMKSVWSILEALLKLFSFFLFLNTHVYLWHLSPTPWLSLWRIQLHKFSGSLNELSLQMNSSENVFIPWAGTLAYVIFELSLFTFALTTLELLFRPKPNQHHSGLFFCFIFWWSCNKTARAFQKSVCYYNFTLIPPIQEMDVSVSKQKVPEDLRVLKDLKELTLLFKIPSQHFYTKKTKINKVFLEVCNNKNLLFYLFFLRPDFILFLLSENKLKEHHGNYLCVTLVNSKQHTQCSSIESNIM